VEKLQQGMMIYTQDDAGKKIAGVITATASAQSPTSFQIIRIVLNDGRIVSASPAIHYRRADNRRIESRRYLDGGIVASVTAVPYSGYTFDILPKAGQDFTGRTASC